MIKVPRLFFEDHEARALPTPVAVRYTARYVWIAPDDPHIVELLSDARYYSDEYGPSEAGGLRTSARATVAALT